MCRVNICVSSIFCPARAPNDVRQCIPEKWRPVKAIAYRIFTTCKIKLISTSSFACHEHFFGAVGSFWLEANRVIMQYYKKSRNYMRQRSKWNVCYIRKFTESFTSVKSRIRRNPIRIVKIVISENSPDPRVVVTRSSYCRRRVGLLDEAIVGKDENK